MPVVKGIPVEVPEIIRVIGQRLLDDARKNDHYTAHPVFIVEQRRDICGIDPDYTEDIAWLDEDSERVSAEEAALLEARHDETGEVPAGFTRTGSTEHWKHVNTYLTHQAAMASIKNGGDHRVVVESAYRNSEIQAVREFLMSLAAAPTQPVQEAATVEAVATTKMDADGGLYLDWLVEGGISALELPGITLLVADRATTNNEGAGRVYTICAPETPNQCGTTSDRYRAELYDEVWEKARAMGYENVTGALIALERMKASQQALAEQKSAVMPDDFELEDMAHSALQEGLSFGVNLDVFMRLARRVASAIVRYEPTTVREPTALDREEDGHHGLDSVDPDTDPDSKKSFGKEIHKR